MRKTFKHYNQDFTVTVEARKGKVVISNNGFIALNKPYKGQTQIAKNVFFDKFVECA